MSTVSQDVPSGGPEDSAERRRTDTARAYLKDTIRQGMDRLLGVDGRDEFTVYLAPVGKVPGR